MDRTLAVKKVKAYTKNPELIQPPTMGEMADLVVLVLTAVQQIEGAIKAGRLDGYTPKPDKDYLSLETAQRALNDKVREMLVKSDETLSQTSQALQERVAEAIQSLHDGTDGIVSDEEIERAANIATSLIELPDFEGMMTEAIQGNGALIRDALESLAEGDEQLTQEAVQGLVPRLVELQERIERLAVSSGGTIGKNQVYNFIAQAVADGTIPAGGGSSTFTALTDTPANYTGQAGKVVVVNIAEDGLEYAAPTGIGTVTSVAVSGSDGIEVDSGSPVTAAGTIALGVNKTGMLAHLNVEDGADVTDATNVTAAGALMDSEVTNLAQVKAFNSADYATAAQGTLAASASQPGHTHAIADTTGLQTALDGKAATSHTHTAANITDFSTAVAATAAVTANTAKVTNATHTGDVTGSEALTIAANAVTNAKAAQMATKTYKGRTSAGTGNSEDVPVATLKTDLVLVKADVGLGNVDNTTDANKPVSTATQTALNLKQTIADAYLLTSEASSATPTITGTALRNDYVATALVANATLAAPSGTANASAVLRYRITASGGTRTIGYNAALLTGNVTRTTSLAAGETLTQIYQRVGSTWVCTFEDVTI